jgi:hypothetical protein
MLIVIFFYFFNKMKGILVLAEDRFQLAHRQLVEANGTIITSKISQIFVPINPHSHHIIPLFLPPRHLESVGTNWTRDTKLCIQMLTIINIITDKEYLDI